MGRGGASVSIPAAAILVAACGLDVVGRTATPSGSNEDGGPFADAAGGRGGGTSDAGDAGTVDSSATVDGSIDAGSCAPCTGVARSLCVSGACVVAQRVFLSSTGSTANLGGVTGANAKCQALADAAKLGGTWAAWLSTSSTDDPGSRFLHSSLPYRLLDGTTIANGWAELVSGTLRAPIQIDENGQKSSPVEVWTGTGSNGGAFMVGCDGFTSGTAFGDATTVGVSDKKSFDWTNVYLQYCDRTEPRLYCFEQ